jgi:hypothetical protein
MDQTLKAGLSTPFGALKRRPLFPNCAILLRLILKFFVLRMRAGRSMRMSKKTPATVINRLFQANNREKQFLIFCRADIGS